MPARALPPLAEIADTETVLLTYGSIGFFLISFGVLAYRSFGSMVFGPTATASHVLVKDRARAEALKHPRHAEAARALERGGRGLGDVAELAARLANEVGADVEAAEALVRRARALYGDAAAAATTTVAAAPAPRAAQQRNRVTARAVRARRTGTSSSPS